MNIIPQQKTLTKTIVMASLSVASMTTLPTYADISMDADEKAALVEQRLQHINEQDAVLLDYLSAHPWIEEIDYTYSDLQHEQGNESASANGELMIKLNENMFDGEVIELTFDESIDYSDALNQEDILARVITDISLKEDSEAFEELSEEERAQIQAFFQKLELRTDLLEGSSLKQYFTIAEMSSEVSAEEPGIDFKGLTAESSLDEENYAKGVGDVHIDMGQLTVTEIQEDIDYEALMALPQEEQDNLAYDEYPMISKTVVGFDMQPFTLDYSLSEDGDISLDSSPIAVSFQDNNGGIVIERITGEGNVSYDEEIGQYLGKQHYTAHNVAIESHDLPEPIVFDTVEYTVDLDRADDDLYDVQFALDITPQANTFDVLTEGMFSVKGIHFSFNGENFSQDSLEQIAALNSHAVDANMGFSDETQEVIESILKSLSNDGATAGLDATFSTDKGDVTFDSSMQLRQGADVQAWSEALDREDSATLEELMKNDLLFEAKMAVPVALLDAVGMTQMAEMMGAPYVVREGGNLTVQVQNEGEGLLVNGQSLEALESGM